MMFLAWFYFASLVMCRMHKCRKRMDAQARPVKMFLTISHRITVAKCTRNKITKSKKTKDSHHRGHREHRGKAEKDIGKDE